MPARSLKANNFDLLRLAAAMQVAVMHTFAHLGVEVWQPLHSALDWIPGVPVFFLISGFLIYQSFAFNHDVRTFARNRALRLYPALIVCFLVSLGAVAACGYFRVAHVPPLSFVAWVVAQVTVFQFYTPDFMRHFASGTLNGSLWTISVELQFYALTPLLFAVVTKSRNRDRAFIAVLVAFLVVNTCVRFVPGSDAERLSVKLLNVSFLPWFYMFVAGAYLSQSPSVLRWVTGISPWKWLAMYVVVSWLSDRAGLAVGNQIHPLRLVVLAGLVFSTAFNNVDLARRMLRGNDVSYGLYIYHMPVANVFIYAARVGAPIYVACSVGVTLVLATFSWFVIEKPSLKLKKRALRPIQTAALPART